MAKGLSAFQKFWIAHLLGSGAVTGILFLAPGLMWLGYFLYFPPLLLLNATPTIFFYSLISTVLLLVLRPLRRLRWGLTTLVLLGLGIYLPYDGNLETFKKVEELTKDDIDVTRPLEPRDTIAIIHSSFRNQTGKDDPQCESLCQRLLYDGMAARVIVGAYQRQEGDEPDSIGSAAFYPPVAYFIEKRDICPSDHNSLDTVSQRIAAGECLESEEATLAEADTLYITEDVERPEHYAFRYPFGLDVAAVNARRKRIVETTAAGDRTLYRKTETTAELMVGPALIATFDRRGTSMARVVGFVRRNRVENDFSNFEHEEEPRIFSVMADAVRLPAEDATRHARMVLLQALSSEGSERQAGHDFFEHYLASFSPRNQHLTPSPEDIDVVMLALADERITASFRDLLWFNRSLETIPDRLIVAIADRILSTPDQYGVVTTLSEVIEALPEGKAAVISAQILTMLQQQELRHRARRAVSRLGDGDLRATEHYFSAIQAWLSSENPRGGSVWLQGPLRGLCRMGERALPVKDDLLQILKTTEDRQLARLLVKALLNMGLEEDLRREFEHQDDRWPAIADTIDLKERYDTGFFFTKYAKIGKVYKEFCHN